MTYLKSDNGKWDGVNPKELHIEEKIMSILYRRVEFHG